MVKKSNDFLDEAQCKNCDKLIISDNKNSCKVTGSEIDDLKTHCANYVKAKVKSNNDNFILDPSELPQQLDHAMGFIEYDNKKLRYYGDFLYEKIKRKNTTTKKRNAVLILENGKILSCDADHKYTDFELITKMTINGNRWSWLSIKDFTDDHKKIEISFFDVYMAFMSIYKRSMVYEADEYYMLNPIWDMLTYFQDITDFALIIKHEGQSGTAKSKGMKISANLAFNGRKFLKPSPATFFRYRHTNKATIYIEEAERLFSNNKNRDDDELVEYINGSYERGNFVPRCNDKNINQIDEFDPFGFTRIGSIAPLRGALENRSATQTMIKAPKNDERGNVEIGGEKKKEFVEARNLAYNNGLKNYNKFIEALKNVKNNFKIANREWLLIRPLLAIANCIDQESGLDNIEQKLGVFLVRLFNIRTENYSDESWELRMASTLMVHLKGNEGFSFVSNTSLKDLFYNSFKDNEFPPQVSSQGLARIMDKIGFKLYRGRDPTGTCRGYNLTYDLVKGILERNDIIHLIPDKEDNKTTTEEFIENTDDKKIPGEK